MILYFKNQTYLVFHVNESSLTNVVAVTASGSAINIKWNKFMKYKSFLINTHTFDKKEKKFLCKNNNIEMWKWHEMCKEHSWAINTYGISPNDNTLFASLFYFPAYYFQVLQFVSFSDWFFCYTPSALQCSGYRYFGNSNFMNFNQMWSGPYQHI